MLAQTHQEMPKAFNAADYFIRQCNLNKHRQEKIAFYYKNNSYTYLDLEHQSNKFCHAFKKLGINSKQRIGILLPDKPEFIFAFWGALKAGIIPVLINTKFNIEDIRFIINDSQIKLIITEGYNKKDTISVKNNWLEKVIFIDQAAPDEENFNKILAGCDESYNPKLTESDAADFWIYTTGSSGNPKGVMHLQKSMVNCVENYGKGVLGLNENDIIYSVSKMAHTYGLGNTTFQTYGAGATSVVCEGETAFEIVEAINQYKPTVFFAVPSVYASLLQISDIENICVSSIRLFVSAGETLPKALWYRWKERFNSEILDGLGTTELLTTFISNRIGDNRPGSTGKPAPGFHIKIVDDDNRLVTNGTVGNLLVSGETLMRGYWNRYEENKRSMVGEYFKTGDKFYQDEDGYLWYSGRGIDVFKVNGRWVKAHEVENILLSHPQIKDTVVLGEISDTETTKIVAYIVVDNTVTPSNELVREIRSFTKARLEHFKCPSWIYFVKKIPKGPTNKTKRVKLDDELILFTYKGVDPDICQMSNQLNIR